MLLVKTHTLIELRVFIHPVLLLQGISLTPIIPLLAVPPALDPTHLPGALLLPA